MNLFRISVVFIASSGLSEVEKRQYFASLEEHLIQPQSFKNRVSLIGDFKLRHSGVTQFDPLCGQNSVVFKFSGSEKDEKDLHSLLSIISGFVSILSINAPIFVDGLVSQSLKNIIAADWPGVTFSLSDYKQKISQYKLSIVSGEKSVFHELAYRASKLAEWFYHGESAQNIEKFIFHVGISDRSQFLFIVYTFLVVIVLLCFCIFL